MHVRHQCCNDPHSELYIPSQVGAIFHLMESCLIQRTGIYIYGVSICSSTCTQCFVVLQWKQSLDAFNKWQFLSEYQGYLIYCCWKHFETCTIVECAIASRQLRDLNTKFSRNNNLSRICYKESSACMGVKLFQ